MKAEKMKTLQKRKMMKKQSGNMTHDLRLVFFFPTWIGFGNPFGLIT